MISLRHARLAAGLSLLALGGQYGCTREERLDGKWFDESRWQVDTVAYATGEAVIIRGFTGPYGIVRDAEGTLYIPDLKEGLVARFDQALAFEGWLGMTYGSGAAGDRWNPSGWHYSGWVARGTAVGMFNMAHSVDFHPDGRLFVADYMNGRIHTYNAAGRFLGLFNSPPLNPDLAFGGSANAWFDADGNLWVSDFDKHRIVKFAPDGSLIGWLGEREDGTLSDGFVTDGVARASGALGGFFKPQMVRVDDAGLVYVVETGNHRIQRFDPDGSPRGWIGARNDGTLAQGWSMTGSSAQSSRPGGFYHPVSLDLTANGMMLVADNHNHRLQRFTLGGMFAGWIGGRPDESTVRDWELTGLSEAGQGVGQFLYPFDVKAYGDLLYVADGHNGRVQILPIAP